MDRSINKQYKIGMGRNKSYHEYRYIYDYPAITYNEDVLKYL